MCMHRGLNSNVTSPEEVKALESPYQVGGVAGIGLSGLEPLSPFIFPKWAQWVGALSMDVQ